MGIALKNAISEAWQGAMEGVDVGYTLQTYLVDPIMDKLVEAWVGIVDFIVGKDAWIQIGQAIKDGWQKGIIDVES